MSKIDKEINELAEKMVKSTSTSKDLLLDTVMELGPEGLKKALPALNDDQKGVLKDFLEDLSKAVSMDDEYTPKKTTTDAEDLKTESLSGSDDEDEDLVKPKAAEHKHQGDDSPKGKEGQVIKASPGAGVGSIVKGDDAEEKKEMKQIAEKEAKEEVEDHNKKLHSKDMKKSEEPNMGIEEMLKSMSEEDMSKMMYKMSTERGMEKSDIYKILMGKGCEQSSLDKCWEGMGSMKKSEEAPAEEKVEKSEEPAKEGEAVEKGKMKILSEEEQSKTKMQDESEKEKIDEEDGELKEKAPTSADEALKDVPKMEKSIVYNPKNVLAANTLGRNMHYNVDEEIVKSEERFQERIEKGAVFYNEDSAPTDEKLEKSEDSEKEDKKEDLNDLIEKSMDTTWKEIEGKAAQEAAEKAKNGKLQKSFDDNDLYSAMGMSEEEAKKVLGE